MIKVKNTKYFTWDVFNETLTVHVNSFTDVVLNDGDIVRCPYRNVYSGCEIKMKSIDKWFPVNSYIAKQLFKYLKMHHEDFGYDYFTVNIKPFSF